MRNLSVLSRSKHYRAFMLRMWNDKSDHHWRYLLEDVGTCQRYPFDTLADLCVYLTMIEEGQAAALPRLPSQPRE